MQLRRSHPLALGELVEREVRRQQRRTPTRGTPMTWAASVQPPTAIPRVVFGTHPGDIPVFVIPASCKIYDLQRLIDAGGGTRTPDTRIMILRLRVELR
jgi:hypothetical protein